MATSKMSERCVFIGLLALTSVTYALGNSGIAGKHRISVAQSSDQAPCISDVVCLILAADL
jgi:hypothetical protein